MSETSTDRRADHEVRKAVGSIQERFLDRVGDRVARGLSLRELGEELIIEALKLSSAHYGCILQLDKDLTVCLEAVVSIDFNHTVRRQHDTLLNRKIDRLLKGVVDSGKACFDNHTDGVLSANLPSCHPPVSSFALLPMLENNQVKALLFIANTRKPIDLVLVNRLQSMLNAFVRIQVNNIINRGINNVITDIGQTTRQLLTLLKANYSAITTLNENGCITAFNPACETLFEISVKPVLGSPADAFFPKAFLKSIMASAVDYQQQLDTLSIDCVDYGETIVTTANGDTVLVQIRYFHTRVNEHTYTTLIIGKSSRGPKYTEEVQNTTLEYKTLAKLAPVGILKLNHDWTCDYANDMWCELSQVTLEKNLGSGWVDTLHEDYRVQVLVDMRNSLEQSNNYHSVVKLNTPHIQSLWVNFSATGLYNTFGHLTGSVVVITDITDQYLAKNKLKEIAHHDALTGLPNRTQFLEHLNTCLSERKPYSMLALLFIDLDGFKAVNDTLGHDAGDELLQQVATRIQQNTKNSDTVARLGGDEFTVTLREIKSTDEASSVAESIVHSLKQPFLLQLEEVYVSASVGIAISSTYDSEYNTDTSALIKQADIALYRAKLSGRSRYVFFTPELDQAQRDRSVLITSLRRAVDRRDFELHYQPQLLIKEQSILGFEALLRWPQASGETISPGAFIDVLEETGLISELGEWAIGEACGQHRIWLRKGLIGPATTMSVNVSARQLGMPDFADRVASILKKHSMRPDSLILEITESALVQTVESNIISQLKNLGVQISLDDFGTGYSSLAYLSQLPLDHLKIDRSFIADIAKFPHAATVVRSIIALARTLGIRVIAEGVEEASVLPILADEGCEGYQGYYFSKALPARQMAARLTDLSTVKLSHYANFIDLDSAVA